MANIVLGFPNQAVTGVTLSGGTWNASYPQTNLLTTKLAQKARTTGILAAAGTIQIDLGATAVIGVIGLIAGNFESGSTYTVNGYTNADFATGNVFTQSGTIHSTGVQQKDCILSLTNAASARYWKITVTNVAPATYTEIGRLFIGVKVATTNNFSVGQQLGAETQSQIAQSVSGVDYFDKRPNYRVFRCTLNWLSDSEAKTVILPFLRSADITEEILVIPYPEDLGTAAGFQTAFLGRMRQLSAIEQPYALQNAVALEFKELL